MEEKRGTSARARSVGSSSSLLLRNTNFVVSEVPHVCVESVCARVSPRRNPMQSVYRGGFCCHAHLRVCSGHFHAVHAVEASLAKKPIFLWQSFGFDVVLNALEAVLSAFQRGGARAQP